MSPVVGVPVGASPATKGSFDTWALIQTDALDRAEEETGVSVSEFWPLSNRAGDRAYQELLNRATWLFSRRPYPLMLQVFAPVTTTITWTSGSYQATLGAAQARSLRGWKVLLAGLNFGVRVVSHVPGSAVVLLEVPNYTGASFAAGTACTLFRDEYDLAQIQDTPTAPAAALIAASPGLLTAGAYTWLVTFGNENGETEAGDASNSVTVADPAIAGQVQLTAIPTGPPGTLVRNVYRTKAGGADYYLAATLADNVTTTFIDNVSDATIVVNQSTPSGNTTGGVRSIIYMQSKGSNVREIEGPFTEAWIKEHYPDPPTPTWPPYGYARLTDTRIRFTQYPSQSGIIEVAHSFVPRDLSLTIGVNEILVPRNWRYVLADGVLFHLLDLKHDDRASRWQKIWEQGITDMVKDDDTKKLGLEGTRNRVREEPPY